MFYRGRIHEVAAEPTPGTGSICWSPRRRSTPTSRVVFLDFEDDQGGIVGWLLAMGARPTAIREHFSYV